MIKPPVPDMVVDIVDDDEEAAIEREARAKMIDNCIAVVPSKNESHECLILDIAQDVKDVFAFRPQPHA